jgi:glycosyltransferase involved in cell wall biosynthesis
MNKLLKIPFLLTKILEIYAFKKYNCNLEMPCSTNGIIKMSSIKNEVCDNPVVSVIVPAYIRNNFEKNCLFRLIQNLNNQTFEIKRIIIVDDFSPYEYKIPNLVLYHRLKMNGGAGKARNKGIEIALDLDSDLILFTDIDCVPDTNWVKSHVDTFTFDRNAHIVSGNTKSFNKNWFGKYHELNGTLNGRIFKGSDLLLYGPTCNLSITKKVAESVKFNEAFPGAAGEDIEFCFRAAEKGFNIKYSEYAVTYHDFGYVNCKFFYNFRLFVKQFEKYSKGECILLKLIPNYYCYLENTAEVTSY